MKNTYYFEDIPKSDFLPFQSGTLLLDIDHTLLPPSVLELGQKGREQILRIKEMGITILLLSNGGRHVRNRALAQTLGVEYVTSRYKKPNKKIISGLTLRQPVVVVGDKGLTDGLFALRIKAPFLRVKRHTSPADSFFDTVACIIDDVLSYLLPI